MARPEKIEVTLSREDRQLLRDIRDALRAMCADPEDEAAVDQVRRLIESSSRGTVPIYCGNGPAVFAPPPGPPRGGSGGSDAGVG